MLNKLNFMNLKQMKKLIFWFGRDSNPRLYQKNLLQPENQTSAFAYDCQFLWPFGFVTLYFTTYYDQLHLTLVTYIAFI